MLHHVYIHARTQISSEFLSLSLSFRNVKCMYCLSRFCLGLNKYAHVKGAECICGILVNV